MARKSKQTTPPAEETGPKKPAPKRAAAPKASRAKAAVRRKSDSIPIRRPTAIFPRW